MASVAGADLPGELLVSASEDPSQDVLDALLRSLVARGALVATREGEIGFAEVPGRAMALLGVAAGWLCHASQRADGIHYTLAAQSPGHAALVTVDSLGVSLEEVNADSVVDRVLGDLRRSDAGDGGREPITTSTADVEAFLASVGGADEAEPRPEESQVAMVLEDLVSTDALWRTVPGSVEPPQILLRWLDCGAAGVYEVVDGTDDDAMRLEPIAADVVVQRVAAELEALATTTP